MTREQMLMVELSGDTLLEQYENYCLKNPADSAKLDYLEIAGTKLLVKSQAAKEGAAMDVQFIESVLEFYVYFLDHEMESLEAAVLERWHGEMPYILYLGQQIEEGLATAEARDYFDRMEPAAMHEVDLLMQAIDSVKGAKFLSFVTADYETSRYLYLDAASGAFPKLMLRYYCAEAIADCESILIRCEEERTPGVVDISFFGYHVMPIHMWGPMAAEQVASLLNDTGYKITPNTVIREYLRNLF